MRKGKAGLEGAMMCQVNRKINQKEGEGKKSAFVYGLQA